MAPRGAPPRGFGRRPPLFLLLSLSAWLARAHFFPDDAADALGADDECGAPVEDQSAEGGCAANALQMRKKVEGLPGSIHYLRGAPHSSESLSNGVQLSHWSHELSHSEEKGAMMPINLVDRPPRVTRIVMLPGQRFPPSGQSIKTDGDVFYVFTKGAVHCDFCKGGEEHLQAGNLFFTTAHRPHGPFVNHGPGEAIIMVAGIKRFTYHHADRKERSGDLSMTQRLFTGPTVQTRVGLKDGPGEGWNPAGLGPMVLTHHCWSHGKVHIHNWPSLLNAPNVMAVRLGHDCFIPCHNHPGGAMYFVVEGSLKVNGDKGVFGNTTYHAGDMRWVRSTFVYGPEYSEFHQTAHLIVLGLPGAVTPGMCKKRT